MQRAVVFVTFTHTGKILCFKTVAEEKMNFQTLPDLPLLSVDILCGTLNVICTLMSSVALQMQLTKRVNVTLILQRGVHKGF